MRNITIEKLFGEHDIRIDLDRKLSIMIGENGIGKSTILDIIYSIYRHDFISLTKYNFERLILSSESDEVVILRSDLFPPLKVILREIHSKTEIFDEEMAVLLDKLSSGLKKAQKNNKSVYYEYLAACLHEKPLSNRIKQNIDSSCYYSKSPWFDPKVELRSVILSKSYSSNSRFSDKHSYLMQSNIEERVKGSAEFIKSLNQFFSKQVLSLNMVNNYAIKESPVDKPPIYSNMIQWLSKYDKVTYLDRFNDNNWHFLNKRGYNSSKLIGLPFNTHDEYNNEYLELAKKSYKNVKYNFFNIKKDIERITEEVNENELIDVNGIINRVYYSEQYMKEINDIAISYYLDLIGKPYDLNDYTNAYIQFNDEEKYNIKNYIKPIILEGSIFAKTISGILDSPIDVNELDILVRRFRKFYDENIGEIISNRNPKINEIERLLNEFAPSKTFIITPLGLKIFIKKYKEYESGKFKVIENEKNEINLSDLSSGEKKLVIILLFSCLFENLVLLLDEPELSFSINWQERILNEVINQDNNNSFVIATHSPFVVSTEEAYNSIVPLPQEE